MIPSFFCRASVSSRDSSQPWSNFPLYLSAHSLATRWGAWLQPVEQHIIHGFCALWARTACNHSTALSVMSSGKKESLPSLPSGTPSVELSCVMIGSYWPAAPVRKPHHLSIFDDCGQWSNEPAAPISCPGVRCHLPKPPVT